jgi:hypothetical protein
MEPWYKVVIPRQELREGRSLDQKEFSVHLKQVVPSMAPCDHALLALNALYPVTATSAACWKACKPR